MCFSRRSLLTNQVSFVFFSILFIVGFFLFMFVLFLFVRNKNKPSMYLGIGLQLSCNWGQCKESDNNLFLMIFPRTSLHYKLVPVQCRECIVFIDLYCIVIECKHRPFSCLPATFPKDSSKEIGFSAIRLKHSWVSSVTFCLTVKLKIPYDQSKIHFAVYKLLKDGISHP